MEAPTAALCTASRTCREKESNAAVLPHRHRIPQAEETIPLKGSGHGDGYPSKHNSRREGNNGAQWANEGKSLRATGSGGSTIAFPVGVPGKSASVATSPAKPKHACLRWREGGGGVKAAAVDGSEVNICFCGEQGWDFTYRRFWQTSLSHCIAR